MKTFDEETVSRLFEEKISQGAYSKEKAENLAKSVLELMTKNQDEARLIEAYAAAKIVISTLVKAAKEETQERFKDRYES